MKDKRMVRLAKLADREGMLVKDVARFPSLLKTIGMKRKEVSDTLIRSSERYLTHWFEKICTKHGANQRPVVEVTSVSEKIVHETTKKKRSTLFGKPATSVIRWMGSQGWDKKDAMSVLSHYELDVAESTVSTQLRAGKKGQRGGPAHLNEKEIEELSRIVE